jgi:hypothetical protein
MNRNLTAPAVTGTAVLLAVMLALVAAVAVLHGLAFVPGALAGLVP